MLDCLTDLKKRVQEFVDGQQTFETLKHAVNREVVNCDDSIVRDFISNIHREGHLSNTHFKTLLEEISIITGQQRNQKAIQAANSDAIESLPKELTVLNDRFVLGPVIGKGGMGVVYKARDLRKMEAGDKDDVVAIKVISADLRSHPESIIALQREAKKAQKLAHPNIINVYDFDRDGDIAYMTMEYLDGVPLSKLIKVHGPLPKKEANRIITNIARGLSYAHKHNIVHSDLKPSNIFLLKNGEIKILDFGIARAFKVRDNKLDNSDIVNKNIFNAFTPAYASCEMINGMQPTPKDDIYALGCVAHEILTRKHPYSRMPADKVKEEQVVFKKDNNLTAHEYRAIMSAIELDKDKRVNSVSDFARTLNNNAKPKSMHLNNKALVAFFVIFSMLIVLYSVNKIKAYEMIAEQKTGLINKLDIDSTLKEADQYLRVTKLERSQKDQVLNMYQHVLELDPDNMQAKAGFDRLAEIYQEDFKKYLEKKAFEQANDIFKTLELSFSAYVDLEELEGRLKQNMTANNIEALLEKAKSEETQNQYVRPLNNNAYDTYMQVLDLAPNEPRAQEGLSRIRMSILSETQALITNNELEKAKERLKDALLVSPGSADALAMYKDIVTKRLFESNQQMDDKEADHLGVRVSQSRDLEKQNDNMDRKPEVKRSAVLQNRLMKLHLKQAEIYLSKNILYGPSNYNAAYHLQQILKLDRDNEYASKGMKKAWKSFIGSVERDVESKQFEKALNTVENSGNHFSSLYDIKTLKSDLSEKNKTHQFKIEQRNKLELYITQAREHVKHNRWTRPKGMNAMESYLKAIKIDPNNVEARSNLKKAKNIIISRVKSNISSEEYSVAEKELQQLLNRLPVSTELNDLKYLLAEVKQKHSIKLMEIEVNKKIKDLEENAIIAFNKKRYIFPIGESAYDYYSEITLLETDSDIAIEGINKTILREYEQIALDIDKKNYYIASVRLNRLSNLGELGSHFDDLLDRLADSGHSPNGIAIQQDSNESYAMALLQFAEQQEEKGIIWPPAIDSAYNVYRYVMDLQPANEVSRKMLAVLFDKRLGMVNSLLQGKRWNQAERELLSLNELYVSNNQEQAISQKLSELSSLKSSDVEASAFENLISY